ncbi:MAG: rhomboid family intramembrane serine protease [Bacteroidetes bacterium]|nr:rhomboid family intramembrane serine protease [Bacteroidota bacterium]
MFEEFKNAFSRSNNGHIQLIIINVVIFVVLGVLFVFARIGGFENIFKVVHDQFLIPPTFAEFATRPWTVITYAFAHSLTDIFHILFNMLALYWFGKLFVEYLGSDKLVALYVLGALAAATFYLLMFNTVPFFKEQSNFPGMVGASGAIYAIMVGAATLLPDYTFFLLFFGPVRIKYIAAIYILISFLGSVGANSGGNIAHLGGALMGFIYIKQLQAGVNWGGWITSVLDWIKNIFKPRAKVKVTYRKTEPKEKSSAPKKASQEEIDAILDKISDRGYESLSKDEKEKLFNASKK